MKLSVLRFSSRTRYNPIVLVTLLLFTVLTSYLSVGEEAECNHPIWCHVPAPTESLFRFPHPPNDPIRWRRAQQVAASGEPLLAKRIVPHFSDYFNFLEGSQTMRSYLGLGDYFMDNNHGFEVLHQNHPGYTRNRQPKTDVFGGPYHKYAWENESSPSVIPEPYKLSEMKRAPVIHIGYFAFDRKGSSSASGFFGGKSVGEAVVDRNKFLRIWQKGKDKIDRPWIGIHYANENWGMFSTYFPNRTVNWGKCCTQHENLIKEMLDHPKTLMLLTNQHHNMTHPKLISLPLGVPINAEHSRRIIFDAVQFLANHGSKEKLIFTASSNWGYRPKVLECLSKKFNASEAQFSTHKGSRMAGRVTPVEYYKRLGRSRFSVALPGLGYDTYRTWEILTLGTIPILEKGIGLDKTVGAPSSLCMRSVLIVSSNFLIIH